MEQKYRNSFDKPGRKKTAPAAAAPGEAPGTPSPAPAAPAETAPRRPAPVSPAVSAAPAPASPAAAPRPPEEMEQVYQYLYQTIPAAEKEKMRALSPAERTRRMESLDEAWKVHRGRLSAAFKTGAEGVKGKKKAGAFAGLMKALPDALYSLQCRAWLQMAGGEKPSLDHYLSCLKPLAEAIKASEGKAEEAVLSEDFRSFLEQEKHQRELRGTSVVKFFLYPALVALFWFGMTKLFSAPFMAGILAHQFWEYIAYVFGVILCLGGIALLVAAGVGFILSIILSTVICGALLWVVGWSFDLVIRLFPAGVQASFADVSVFGKVFFGPLWLILFLASAVFVLYSLCYHGDAFGKAGNIKKTRQALREALPRVEKDRQFYGLLLETADYCEAAIRWEEGRKEELRSFTGEEAAAVTDGVRQLLRPACQRYDEAVETLSAGE